jgi:glycosyltransferase involved in cell wall biosynthesis
MPFNIIWWETHLTNHQLHTLNELADINNLTLIVEKKIKKNRQKQGWTLDQLVNPKIKYVENLLHGFYILISNNKSIVIFAGPFESWKSIIALFIIQFTKKKYYILSEPYSDIKFGLLSNSYTILNRFKYYLRPIIYRMYYFLFFVRASGFFVISKKAYNQFRRLGISEEKLFPYCYFVPSFNFNLDITAKQAEKNSLSLVFVGNLIHTKGIDILLKAIDELIALNFKIKLDVYGAGDWNSFKIDNNFIKYKGIIPFGQTPMYLVKYDALVLPSRYDGWGVVVNESISSNVPVICSNLVGASGLIKKYECGLVLENLSVESIKNSLLSILKDTQILNKWKKNTYIINEFISPLYGATYLNDILNKKELSTLNIWYD